MKVLVVGATGKYAGLVVPELKKRGATVRALVREVQSEAKARSQGADEIAVGDLADEASLRRAAEGAEGVFHLNPAFAPDEAAIGPRMVSAAGCGSAQIRLLGCDPPIDLADEQPCFQARNRGGAV